MKKLVFFIIAVFVLAAAGCKSAPAAQSEDEDDFSVTIVDDTKIAWIEITEGDVRIPEIAPDQPAHGEAEAPALLSGESETLHLLFFEDRDDTADDSVMTGAGSEIPTWETNGEIRLADAMASEPDINHNEPRAALFSVPLISGFEREKYYVQLASYRNADLAQSEIARIGNGVPVVIMRTHVTIRGEDTLVHRILLGPLDYGESRSLLQRFKADYGDAFVWLGR